MDERCECLGDTDEIIILQRKIWEREIKALTEGKTPKRCERSPRLTEMSS